MTGDQPITPSPAEEAYQAAKSLPPNDRLRLILRLWGSLPPDFWAAPSSAELAEAFRRVNEVDVRGFAESPWEILLRSLIFGRGRKPPRIYSAPRRFDLATIFVVMAAFSVLMGVMSMLNFEPVESLVIAGFVTLVGITQAVLFGGRRPRLASLLAGFVCFALPMLVMFTFFTPVGLPSSVIIVAIIECLVFGPLFGYVAGVFVGGTFLVAALVRKAFRRLRTSTIEEPLKDDA